MAVGKEKCLEILKANLLVLLTLVGAAVGFIIGVVVRNTNPTDSTLMWVGEIYLNMLKMMIVPLIVASVITGTATLDPKSNGKISLVSLGYIMSTNFLGCLVGRKLLPGRQTGTEEVPPLWGGRPFKMKCPNGVSPFQKSLTDRGSLHGRECATIVLSRGMLRKDCLDLQEKDRTVSSTIQSSRTETGPLNLNGTTQEAGSRDGIRAVLNSDKEATPSGGLDCYLLKCLWNILGHGAPELDHSLLPGGYLLVEEILKGTQAFDGYSLPDIHKLIKVDVDRRFTLIKDSDSGCWKIRANQGYSLMVDTPAIPLEEKCEVGTPRQY
ncbi:EAAT2 [Mytilus edulis]|uniref:Amino acid transporter n=1 Tax=Mytilus edulis TaxID=6550 RepID=A0A8S3S4G0_MYTED|nr:EAAT2 [Mytilus edulis]